MFTLRPTSPICKNQQYCNFKQTKEFHYYFSKEVNDFSKNKTDKNYYYLSDQQEIATCF